MVTTRTLPAEFALACACCRPDGAARDSAVQAAASDIDWGRFARVLARHRVEGLAHEALRMAGVAMDAPEARSLRRTATEIGAAGLRLAAESARLQAVLDEAGIANLILKGATIDRLAWGRIGLKRAWDIDLLVLPADTGRARRVLTEAGYDLTTPEAPDEAVFETWVSLAKECVFHHRESGLVVELHWRVADAATLLPTLTARAPSQVVRLSPTLSLRTFEDAALFAYLCVHGTSHAWSRLKWLADIGAILAKRDEAGRIDLYRRARPLVAGHCPATALLLCEQLLGLPLPAALASELRANRKARRLADLALDAMTGGNGTTEIASRTLFSERILLSHLLFADGWKYLWTEGSRQSVSLHDHQRLRLPPALGFLYAPLRAPLWVWRRIRRL